MPLGSFPLRLERPQTQEVPQGVELRVGDFELRVFERGS